MDADVLRHGSTHRCAIRLLPPFIRACAVVPLMARTPGGFFPGVGSLRAIVGMYAHWCLVHLRLELFPADVVLRKNVVFVCATFL